MFLSFPAGAGASERTWSYTGSVITKYRTRTDDDFLETLTIISDFIKNPSYSFDEITQGLQEFINSQVVLSK